MPEKFDRIVRHVKENCMKTGADPKRCERIAYGTATNHMKKEKR
jgi:hypothetical protein